MDNSNYYFKKHTVCKHVAIDWNCRIGYYRFHNNASSMSVEERKSILAKMGLYFVKIAASTFSPPKWYLANKVTRDHIQTNHVSCFGDDKMGYNPFSGLGDDFYLCPAKAADAKIALYLRNNS
jgi:hypothetical protein